MEINPYIFRAYDIRGVYGKDFDDDTFKKIGFVLGKRKEKFLVGNDIRKSGINLAQALIQGLQNSGAEVIYSGTAPFGQILFSGLKLNVNKTLYLSASHLPPEWNGLKMYFGDGEPFSKEMIEKIRDEVIEIEEKKFEFQKPTIEEVNLKNDYLDALFKNFPLLKNNNLKIVVDCGDGAMGLVAPEVFDKFGFRVIELFCQPNPDFPNRPNQNTEPTLEATEKLREKVIKEEADFGVAFDGDGDRSAIIDDKGNYLNGNQMGIILGKEILSESKEKRVIKTIACSLSVEEELKPLGAKIIEVPVGHTYVISGCKKEKAKLGVEESGHIVMKDYFLFDDAILVPLKIAEIILKERKKLSQLVDEIEIYPFEEIVFECSDETKFGVVENLIREFKRKYGKVSTLDGIKVSFDDSWILIRAAHTSPKIRLYVEAKTKEKFNFLKQKFSQILTEHITNYVLR